MGSLTDCLDISREIRKGVPLHTGVTHTGSASQSYSRTSFYRTMDSYQRCLNSIEPVCRSLDGKPRQQTRAYLLSSCGRGFVAHIYCLVPREQFCTNALVCSCWGELPLFCSCAMWLLKASDLWSTESHCFGGRKATVLNRCAPWQPLWTTLLPSHSCVYFYRVVK